MRERRFPFADGISAIEREGDGARILWIHGYTLHAESWRPVWDRLPEHAHVGIDLPGHGRSDPLAAGTTLADLGGRIARAALRLGIRHVVGLSLGSMIALQVAIAAPDAFDTLTLAAPALGGGPSDMAVAQRYAELEALYRLVGKGPGMRSLWMASPPDLFRHAADKPAIWAAMSDIIDGYAWQEFDGRGVSRMKAEIQSLADIQAISARTLLLVGEHEFPAFRQTADILADTIADARIVELDGVGHLCMIEVPDRAARCLAEHVAASAVRRKPTKD